MHINRELLKQIAIVLNTHLGDEMQRRAIIESALFESPTLEYIEWHGASYPFALRLTRLLIRLEDGDREEPELLTLLREIRGQVGYDRQLEIDEIIETLSSTIIWTPPPPLNYIFISYTHDDVEFANRLRNDLHSRDIKIWIDFIGLKAGTPDWEKAIRKAIRDSRAVLLVASPKARESFYVRDEIAVANMEKKPIYPIWAKGKEWIDSVPLGMGMIQHIDARVDNYDAALEQLVEMFQSEELETIIIDGKDIEELPSDFVPRNPYKGLRAFRAEDKGDFFGRDTLISEFVNALQSDAENANCLAVVGPSGSGKSSVVMAGLIPALKNGALPGSSNWFYPHPIVPGTNPIHNLTEALAQAYSDVSSELIYNSIQQALRSPDKMGLYDIVQEKTAQSGERLVLYIDQFEELFTLTESENERQQFIDLLVAAATERESRLILILSMRADFSDRPMHYPLLGRLLDQRSHSVLPMRLADLRDVIVKPTEQKDVRLQFDDGLVTELVYALREQSAALPLLQFTLDQLFEHRDGQHLTMAAYEAIGGLHGALAKHAQATYDSIPKTDRPFVRRLFLRLIEPGLTEQDTTRRRATFAELELEDQKDTATLKHIMDVFVNARLLLTDNIRGVNTVEVSHETLIREWELLQEWLKESRGDIRFQSVLSRDVAVWVQHGQKADDELTLYHGARLAEAQKWLKRNIPSKAEQKFIKASHDLGERRKEEEREIENERQKIIKEAQELDRRRKQRSLRLFFGTTVLPISLIVAIVGVLYWQEIGPVPEVIDTVLTEIAPEQPTWSIGSQPQTTIIFDQTSLVSCDILNPCTPTPSATPTASPTNTPSLDLSNLTLFFTPRVDLSGTSTTTPSVELQITTINGLVAIMRESHSTSARGIAEIDSGTVVRGTQVTGEFFNNSDVWRQINYEGQIGYVHGSLVQEIAP